MVTQGIFIRVAIGVFFAGLGIGYVAMQSSTPTSSMMVNSQQMLCFLTSEFYLILIL